MQTILQTIAEYAKTRVEADRQLVSLEEMKERACGGAAGNGEAFVQALQKPGLSFICEVKKASPSKGVIDEKFPYLQIAREYADAGADCISCLTEPKWFLGSDRIFQEIRKEVSIPMLRKDFVVDAYQIYQAKVMGANAVLLICAVLGRKTLEEYLCICRELGLAALVEAHDDKEIADAVAAGAQIIGVNNWNLKDFSVDVGNSGRLRSLVPDGVLFVAESGIRTPEEVAALSRERVDAVLIGETLMRAENKRTALEELKSRL